MTLSQKKQNRKKGCLIGGCATLAILGALGIGGLSLVYSQFASMTAEQPPVLPEHVVTAAAADQLDQKIVSFQEAIKEDRSATLVITADDLNTLAQRGELGDQVYFSIVDDQLMMQGGVSLRSVPGMSDRYLNGTYALDVFLDENGLVITPTSFDLEGQEIPKAMKQDLIESMKERNLAKEILRNKAIRNFVDSIETLSIHDNQITIAR